MTFYINSIFRTSFVMRTFILILINKRCGWFYLFNFDCSYGWVFHPHGGSFLKLHSSLIVFSLLSQLIMKRNVEILNALLTSSTLTRTIPNHVIGFSVLRSFIESSHESHTSTRPCIASLWTAFLELTHIMCFYHAWKVFSSFSSV